MCATEEVVSKFINGSVKMFNTDCIYFYSLLVCLIRTLISWEKRWCPVVWTTLLRYGLLKLML